MQDLGLLVAIEKSMGQLRQPTGPGLLVRCCACCTPSLTKLKVTWRQTNRQPQTGSLNMEFLKTFFAEELAPRNCFPGTSQLSSHIGRGDPSTIVPVWSESAYKGISVQVAAIHARAFSGHPLCWLYVNASCRQAAGTTLGSKLGTLFRRTSTGHWPKIDHADGFRA